MKQVLFLCTGNYYRSRFAEIFFNHLASQTSLPWHADSSGLYVQPDGVVNAGCPFPSMRHMAFRRERFPLTVRSTHRRAAGDGGGACRLRSGHCHQGSGA